MNRMNKTYSYMWQQQPYRSWKPTTIKSVVPVWSKPYTNISYTNNNDLSRPHGPAFKARPLRHWRKQLLPRGNNRGKTGIGMPMDVPGGQNSIISTKENSHVNEVGCINNSSIHLNEYILHDNIQKTNNKHIIEVSPMKFLNRNKYNPQLVDLK